MTKGAAMTGPTQSATRPTPGPARSGQPRPASGPTRRKVPPQVYAAVGLNVALGFIALTGWVGLVAASVIAFGTSATAASMVAVKRRRARLGRSRRPLFPGHGRSKRGVRRRGSAPGGGTFGRGRTGRRPATGTGSRVGTSGRRAGLRGLLGKKHGAASTRSGRPAGSSRNPFSRNRARTGTGSPGSRAAGQSRFRNPFKRSKGVGTSTSTGTTGTGRSRNPFRRTTGNSTGTTGKGTGTSRFKNPFKRTGSRTGTSTPTAPTGTGTSARSRNPFRRRNVTRAATPDSGSTGTTPSRSRFRNPFKRTPASNPIQIRKGTPAPSPPTRAQIKEGIRAQRANRLADAQKASGRPVSGWLGRLGQPKPPKPATTAPTSEPTKATAAAAPLAAAAPTPTRQDARTGQDQEPASRPTPPPPPAKPQREAPAPERPARHKICPDHGANCTVDHAANKYGYKHDQPGRVPTTGGKRMTHAVQSSRRDYDDMGLVAFVNAQGGLHEGAAALADEGRRMLAAADNQPLAPEVRANLEQFVAMLSTAAGASEALVPAARRLHETDFARAEEPRGSRTQEKNADVTKTEADGY